MLQLSEIARLEEARQARGLAVVALESRPFAGGTAGRAAPGTWANNIAGAGLDRPLEAREAADITEWYTAAGIEPRIEIAPFVDPASLVILGDLGFRLHSFESVFFREVSRAEDPRPISAPPANLELRRIDKSDEAAIRTYTEAVLPNFMPPGVPATEEHYEIAARAVRYPLTVAFGAWMDGKCVGGGSMECAGEVAALFGLAVHPDYRRRGIQQALIAARLAVAAESGARIATISGRPGAGTERNVRRMGFQCAYTKSVLVKPGPGLVGVIG